MWKTKRKVNRDSSLGQAKYQKGTNLSGTNTGGQWRNKEQLLTWMGRRRGNLMVLLHCSLALVSQKHCIRPILIFSVSECNLLTMNDRVFLS